MLISNRHIHVEATGIKFLFCPLENNYWWSKTKFRSLVNYTKSRNFAVVSQKFHLFLRDKEEPSTNDWRKSRKSSGSSIRAHDPMETRSWLVRCSSFTRQSFLAEVLRTRTLCWPMVVIASFLFNEKREEERPSTSSISKY